MPRELSRFALRLLHVGRERLRALDDAAALAEGVQAVPEFFYDDSACPRSDPDCLGEDGECHDACGPPPARQAFARLWDSLHDADGERWADNPGVVVLRFGMLERRVDELVPGLGAGGVR